MIPAKTDAQNATVSAMIGTEVAMVVALAGFLSRIECPHICLLIKCRKSRFVEAIALREIFKRRGF
jgi:hypothetical protein